MNLLSDEVSKYKLFNIIDEKILLNSVMIVLI